MEFIPVTPEEAQSVAVAMNALHGMVNAMDTLAGEEDSARRTANRIAEVTHLTGDRLGELMASNPNLTDERIAELGHLFRDGHFFRNTVDAPSTTSANAESPPGDVQDGDAPTGG